MLGYGWRMVEVPILGLANMVSVLRDNKNVLHTETLYLKRNATQRSSADRLVTEVWQRWDVNRSWAGIP